MPAKMESAVLTMNFELPGVPSTSYIDLSQCASILNRRAYRQGKNWAVAGFRFGSTARTAQPNISVKKLPTTWVVSGSWMKAFQKWKKQQDKALADSSSMDTKARYNDFKIYMDEFHQQSNVSNNLLPVSPGGFINNVPYLAGEWEASEIVMPNDPVVGSTTIYNLHMVGASTAVSKFIIGGYAFSRAKPFSPDPNAPAVETSWMNQMFDESDSNPDIIDNAIDVNDDTPYDVNTYPNQLITNGGQTQLHREISFTTTTIGAHQDMAGGQFPCGLIQVNHSSNLDPGEYITMQVFLVPGKDRGYLLQDMKEMN